MRTALIPESVPEAKSDASTDGPSDVRSSGGETPSPATSRDEADADRRFRLITCSIFLTIFTIQYVMRVSEKPKPLPWRRGAAFQLFRVDVNTADWIAWTQLEGIGPSLAHRILADRAANGPFSSIDDLQRVEGIGATTLDRIRPWLTIGHEPATQRTSGQRRQSARTASDTETSAEQSVAF